MIYTRTQMNVYLETLTLYRCRHYGPRIFARYFCQTGVSLRDLPSLHSQVRGRRSNTFRYSQGRELCELAGSVLAHFWCSRGLKTELYY